MLRLRFAAALLLLVPAAAAACGGDDDAPAGDAGAAPTVSEADARRTEVAQGLEQPVPPDRPLPTPTPLPDGLPVIQVVTPGGTAYTPTRDEFKALPATTLKIGGKEYTGVTLASLAAKAGAPAGAVATIQGTRIDNLRLGALRYPLADIGATTLLVINQSGYLDLVSSSIPQEQWLHTLSGIAFQ